MSPSVTGTARSKSPSFTHTTRFDRRLAHNRIFFAGVVTDGGIHRGSFFPGGPPDAAVLDEYKKAGIQDTLLAIPDLSRDEILKHIDKIAPLAKAYA